MVVTSSVGIVPSWKWGPERCQLKWLNVTNLYQFWEQLDVSDGDGVPLWLVFVNLLSVRFVLWAAWPISRLRCCPESRRSYGYWLPQVGATSFTWQMAHRLDEWPRDLLIWQRWWASRMYCLSLDIVFKQTCQPGQSFLYLPNVVPEFFLNVFYGTDSSFPLVSHISWPLEINSVLNISLGVSYDVCMHDTRNMEWYVMLKNA